MDPLVRKQKPRITAMLTGWVIEALMEDPVTITDIMEETGASNYAVKQLVSVFRRKGWIFLWDKHRDAGGRQTICVWKWGPGKPDRFVPEDPSARFRRYRANRKARDAINPLHSVGIQKVLAFQRDRGIVAST